MEQFNLFQTFYTQLIYMIIVIIDSNGKLWKYS